MYNGKSVTVVFPAYNEGPNIQRAVKDFLAVKNDGGNRIVDEVLVVDNNSRDGTGDLARTAGARVVLETKQGYGNALQRGLREASTDLIVLCEPDGTFVATDLFKLLSYSAEFEMVCGTRTTREMIWDEANMGWFLRLGNYVVAKTMEVLYNLSSFSDCGCTFRLIRREGRDKIMKDLFVGRSHFLPNMVIAARMNGLSIIEIPVSYRGRIGESKITGTLSGTWKTGLNMIKLILTQWPGFVVRRIQEKRQERRKEKQQLLSRSL